MELDKITKVDGKYIESTEHSAETIQNKLTELENNLAGTIKRRDNIVTGMDKEILKIQSEITKIKNLQMN